MTEPAFEIKSLIPGRLRVKVGARLFSRIASRSSEAVAAGVAASAEVNPLTRSVLLEYDARSASEAAFFGRLFSHWGLGAGEVASFAAEVARATGKEPPLPADTAGGRTAGPGSASAWAVKSEIPGRIRLVHPYIARYAGVAASLDSCLMALGGVSDYSVNTSTSTVLVTYDAAFLPREELLDALQAAVQSVELGTGTGGMILAPLELDGTTLHLCLSSATVALATASYFVPVVGVVATVGTLVAAGHILISAARAIFVDRKVKVDVLDATVITMALAYRKLFPAAFMVWVVDVSNVLLDASSRASRRKLAEMFGRQVRHTRLLVDGAEVDCKVADLQLGDVIVVRSGEQIPVDGVVTAGGAMVDQSALTGEYAPAEKVAGDKVFAMSVALTGRVEVRVSETGEDTNASKMVKLIEQSAEHKVRIQSMTERFADMMVIPTLSLGGVGYLIAGPGSMMAIVNADFGTGIRIAGPLAMLASLSAAAKNGILVKKGSVLESLCKTTAVVFDKTGTLTQEVPVVSRILPLDPAFDEAELLRTVASAEQRFKHPIARAILGKAHALGLVLSSADDSDYEMGYGIHVVIEGQKVRVGSRRYMEDHHIGVPTKAARYLEEIDEGGGSGIFAAVGERMIGLLELSAEPRHEARDLITNLREKRGIDEIYLISGDHDAPTRALARRLGIQKYFAEVLPQHKAEYVKSLQARGLKVAMIGDGINDTVGLSQADCSISLRGAADAATDIADIVFMDGNLRRFELLFEISENLTHNVRRSFMLTLVPNSFLIAGALAGVFGLGSSLFLNNVFNLVATGNGLRAQERLLGRRSDEKIEIRVH